MKILVIAFLCFSCLTSFSQKPSKTNVRFKTLGKDSINLHFDPDYFLIEDTCSSIVRYGHFRVSDRKFFGHFRDLNKLDPMVVTAEGNYTNDGKLDGDFVMSFLDGSQLAKGTFVNGKMIGKWEVFYAPDKPRVKFENMGGVLSITDAWNKDGKQTVINGNGIYLAILNELSWYGKLLNGTPDGVWKCRKTDDRTETVLSSEVFKKGIFTRGSGPIGTYSDASRMNLIDETLLPISNAGLMRISPTACDPSMSRNKVVYAVYKYGAYTDEIKSAIAPVFKKLDLKRYINKKFSLIGTINEKGYITGLKYQDAFDDAISSTLMTSLYGLPPLEPALINGKPAPSPIEFHFVFDSGQYSFGYKLLPVKPKKD